MFWVHVDREWLDLIYQEDMHHLPTEYHRHFLEEPLEVPHPLRVNFQQASQQGRHQLSQTPAEDEFPNHGLKLR